MTSLYFVQDSEIILIASKAVCCSIAANHGSILPNVRFSLNSCGGHPRQRLNVRAKFEESLNPNSYAIAVIGKPDTANNSLARAERKSSTIFL